MIIFLAGALFSALFLVPASCQTYPVAHVLPAFGPFLSIQWAAVPVPAEKPGMVLSSVLG